MHVKTFLTGPLSVNTYLIYADETGEACVIDPGDAETVISFCAERDLRVSAILLTHGHFDHIGGADTIRDRYGSLVYVHGEDMAMLADARQNLSLPFLGRAVTCMAGETMTDGMTLSLLGTEVHVLHTPGHTRGGVSFVWDSLKMIFTGDTLFRLGAGRTDFPGGSFEELSASIRRLFGLDGEWAVMPGHGEASTLSLERSRNPFVRYSH